MINHRDIITIIKPNGEKIENIKANVQSHKIFIHDKTIPLEDGDTIRRILPTGITENYSVLDNGFYHGGNGLPGGYQAKVQKETLSSYSQKVNSSNIYHINASNSNVNVSPTNSHITNVMHEENIFSKIRDELDTKIRDDELKTKIMLSLSELEQCKNTSKFRGKYDAFVSLLANYVTIITPFLPALAKMLA